MTDADLDIVIPSEFAVDDEAPRRAFEDALAWCATQSDDRLGWLRTRIIIRLGPRSFFAQRLRRTAPRENLVFLMIVAANLRTLRERFEREELPGARPAALLEEARPC